MELGRFKTLVLIEGGTRPFPYTTVMSLVTLSGDTGGGATSRSTQAEANKMAGRLRDRMPVAITSICSAFITALELVQEQSKLRLSGDSTPLSDCIGEKIIVGGHHGPQMREFHRNGAVHGEDLSTVSVSYPPVAQ